MNSKLPAISLAHPSEVQAVQAVQAVQGNNYSAWSHLTSAIEHVFRAHEALCNSNLDDKDALTKQALFRLQNELIAIRKQLRELDADYYQRHADV